MKTTLIKPTLFAALMLGATIADAQTYKQSMVPWKDHKLTWNDFKALYPTKDTLAYEISYHATSRRETKKVGDTTYEFFTYDSYVNALDSWVKPENKTDDLLKLCQTHFDLWELCVRKSIEEYCSTPDAYADEIFDFHKRLCIRRQKEQYQLTKHGTDHAAVEHYAQEVKRELAQTEFHPERYDTSLEIDKGVFYSFGLETHIPFTSYFKPFFGFTLNAGYYFKRSMLGLELNMEGFSKCKEHIYTKKGEIAEGDYVWTGSMSLIYGQYIKNGRKVDLMPYVGLGVRSYDGGDLYEQYQKKNNNGHVERAGISLSLGMITDVILKRKVMLKTRSSSIEQLNNCLRLRPYFNLTYYPKTLGWIPALNVAIEFNQKAYRMKKQ